MFTISFNIIGRCPKYHDNFINCFWVIAIFSFFLSFPLSFYVDYKLKSENYLVCWYVKKYPRGRLIPM
ncbi:DUF1240 domain-containing protein [Photorhabdus cinerea]|uniref:DUF1240 domain-containing protein n=1 Tax=Photorhabdus cinerea TaxID=471575 RepID=UPI0030D73E67